MIVVISLCSVFVSIAFIGDMPQSLYSARIVLEMTDAVEKRLA